MTDLSESVRPAAPSRAGGHGLPGRVTPPGVALTIVLAGQMMAVIDTNIVNTTRFHAPAGKLDEHVDGRRGQLGKMFALRHYGPDKVANAILSSVKKGKPIRPVAPEAYALYGVSRVLPQALRSTARMRVI